MTNAVDSGTISDFQLNRFAQIVERAGLAIMGAMGGFFVAALVSRANIGEINSAGILFAVIVYSSAGFYRGPTSPRCPRPRPISQYHAMAQVSAGTPTR